MYKKLCAGLCLLLGNVEAERVFSCQNRMKSRMTCCLTFEHPDQLTLTCILCKVMEHIILSNMWKHLHKHNIILHFQHGFQSGLSCESQLIETVHDWMTAMDNKTQIDAILLDFAKAFDKVPHLRLLSKLTSYGITGNTQNWIKSFLSNRKQRVSVNGALSDITDVTSGVPQGSVLGPVLFLLYINYINGNIKSSIRLFADDSIIYR